MKPFIYLLISVALFFSTTYAQETHPQLIKNILTFGVGKQAIHRSPNTTLNLEFEHVLPKYKLGLGINALSYFNLLPFLMAGQGYDESYSYQKGYYFSPFIHYYFFKESNNSRLGVGLRFPVGKDEYRFEHTGSSPFYHNAVYTGTLLGVIGDVQFITTPLAHKFVFKVQLYAGSLFSHARPQQLNSPKDTPFIMGITTNFGFRF